MMLRQAYWTVTLLASLVGCRGAITASSHVATSPFQTPSAASGATVDSAATSMAATLSTASALSVGTAASKHRNILINQVGDRVLRMVATEETADEPLSRACAALAQIGKNRDFLTEVRTVGIAPPRRRFTACRVYTYSTDDGERHANAFTTFNDSWLIPTVSGQTRPELFYASTHNFRVPTMRWSESPVEIYTRNSVFGVRMRFRDQRYYLLLVSGKGATIGDIARIASQISRQPNINELWDLKALRIANLEIPRFALHSIVRYCNIRCTSTGRRFVSEGVLRIGERGAGAASLVPSSLGKYVPLFPRSVRHSQLRFNHPFYFALIDSYSGLYIFSGFVAHPVLNA